MFSTEDRSVQIKEFWQWFDENKFHYMDPEDEWDGELDLLQEKVESIDPGLSVEITSDMESFFELTISANGEIGKFPMVRETVSKAPKIEGWEIVAFKQPIGVGFTINEEDFQFKTSEMYFYPYYLDDYLDIVIYTDNLEKVDEDMKIYYGYKILMEVIGEYDAATKVKNCFLYDMADFEKESLIPLSLLKQYIEENFYNNN
jgi:hypothetical protein